MLKESYEEIKEQDVILYEDSIGLVNKIKELLKEDK